MIIRRKLGKVVVKSYSGLIDLTVLRRDPLAAYSVTTIIYNKVAIYTQVNVIEA